MAVILPVACLGVWASRRNVGMVDFANIAEGTHEWATTKFPDEEITEPHLLVKVGTDAMHIAVAGADDLPIGTCPDETTARDLGVAVPVFILGKGSTKLMVASEAIPAGVEVFGAADGKIALAGKYRVGVTLTAVTAANELVEVADTVADSGTVTQ